jgi:uncharacterized protein YdeI (YjbR/CyaY-like superfamily)
MMETSKTVYCSDHASWSQWLTRNHDSAREIWLLFPKKHTKKPCISYSDALDEALCHGWIDSLIKRIDNDWYARKFTPRTNHRKWSELNKQRVANLIKQRRMLSAGMEKFKNQQGSASEASAQEKPKLPSTVPAFIRRSLKKNAKAWENFNKLAPSHRRRYVGWIVFAKRDDTRQKRLSEAIRLLAANQKLGLK